MARHGFGSTQSRRWTGRGRGSPSGRSRCDELLLVLDDYHLIDTEQVHKPIAFLLEHCLARVLRAFSEPPAATGARQHAAAAVPGLVEQLTPRELEILALLAAGTPSPRIAEQLVVSLDELGLIS
jgi:ATP/maltotriose-dependent transcriptional regulator MalT